MAIDDDPAGLGPGSQYVDMLEPLMQFGAKLGKYAIFIGFLIGATVYGRPMIIQLLGERPTSEMTRSHLKRAIAEVGADCVNLPSLIERLIEANALRHAYGSRLEAKIELERCATLLALSIPSRIYDTEAIEPTIYVARWQLDDVTRQERTLSILTYYFKYAYRNFLEREHKVRREEVFAKNDEEIDDNSAQKVDEITESIAEFSTLESTPAAAKSRGTKFDISRWLTGPVRTPSEEWDDAKKESPSQKYPRGDQIAAVSKAKGDLLDQVQSGGAESVSISDDCPSFALGVGQRFIRLAGASTRENRDVLVAVSYVMKMEDTSILEEFLNDHEMMMAQIKEHDLPYNALLMHGTNCSIALVLTPVGQHSWDKFDDAEREEALNWADLLTYTSKPYFISSRRWGVYREHLQD